MTGDPWSKDGSRNEGDHEHVWHSWKDDISDDVRHNEVYDVDDDNNVTNYHYHQEDERDGTSVTYNYHTEEWEEDD